MTVRAGAGGAETAERAAGGFVGIARAAGAAHPGAGRGGYSPTALEAFDRLRSFVPDRVPAVRFENGRTDVTVRCDPGCGRPGVSGARTGGGRPLRGVERHGAYDRPAVGLGCVCSLRSP